MIHQKPLTLHVTDEEWASASNTWKALCPHIDFDNHSGESVEQYKNRIVDIVDVPLLVVEQWLHP